MSEGERQGQGQILLEARDLHRSFRLGHQTIQVLRGVNLQIRERSFLALRGASGAGKSTLLHLLGGLDRPTRGEILWRGTPLTRLSDTQLTRFRNQHVGFVFQAYYLFPELDALENVALPARMARVPAQEAEAKAVQLLQRVGLGDRLKHRPNELSGGEQQRVAIARALINDPELILADEPTGNLDSRSGAEILALLREIHEEKGTALLIATHDDRVAAAAPEVVELVDGRIVNTSS